jgi:hypothetical protein
MGDDGVDSTVDETGHQPDAGTDEDSGETDADQVLEALAHPRRRHLVDRLAEDGPELSMQRLAAGLAAAESEGGGGATDEHRQRVYLSLYHRHVPTLEDLGFVRYDDGADVVRAMNVDAVRAVRGTPEG